jgi:hypothetical protein
MGYILTARLKGQCADVHELNVEPSSFMTDAERVVDG